MNLEIEKVVTDAGETAYRVIEKPSGQALTSPLATREACAHTIELVESYRRVQRQQAEQG